MKAVRILAAAALILLSGSVGVAQLWWFEVDYDYYSDATFTDWIGWSYSTGCDGSDPNSGGSTSDYRTKTQINCQWHTSTVACQQFVNGAWQPISCP